MADVPESPEIHVSADQEALVARSRQVGRELASSVGLLLEAIPGGPHRPTHLARRLGLSRVIVSRTLNSTAATDPLEVLDRIPGPESLRGLARSARDQDVSESVLVAVESAIERFESLIRDEFGTRSALKAAISSNRPESRERFAQSSRYQVFNGMSQVLGVQAEKWLTCMILVPSRDDPSRLDVIALHGALGIQRLRSDVAVHFTFGARQRDRARTNETEASGNSVEDALPLHQFYTNSPAETVSTTVDGQVQYRLEDDRLGRKSKMDMLAVGHTNGGSDRYATAESPRRGTAAFPDVPVKLLVSDVYVADGVFPNASAELIVHNTAAAGRANVNDPRRDTDRVAVPETAEFLGHGSDCFDLPDVPHYLDMLRHVAHHREIDLETLRGYRARVPYPVYGFQYALTFLAPLR